MHIYQLHVLFKLSYRCQQTCSIAIVNTDLKILLHNIIVKIDLSKHHQDLVRYQPHIYILECQVNTNGAYESDVNQSLSLGGITDGVTNVELTAAYAVIANQGTYNKPVLYTTVKDSNGNVLLSNKTSSRKVMKKSTAWLLTNAMEDVIKKGTGREATSEELREAIRAAKKESVSCIIDAKVLPKTMAEGYESWWHIGVASTSKSDSVKEARKRIDDKLAEARMY